MGQTWEVLIDRASSSNGHGELVLTESQNSIIGKLSKVFIKTQHSENITSSWRARQDGVVLVMVEVLGLGIPVVTVEAESKDLRCTANCSELMTHLLDNPIPKATIKVETRPVGRTDITHAA